MRDIGGAPIRFVPGARRSGDLIFRTDANAQAQGRPDPHVTAGPWPIIHWLPLGGGHVMQEHGGPAGLPALVLHGGPGSGSSPLLRRGFDPARYRIICPDQRESGRSTPASTITANTLADLLDDLRRLRDHLRIARWLVVGRSWGATLALAHALGQPDAVAGLLLRNVFLARACDIHDLFAQAVRHGNPEWRLLWNEARRRQCPITAVIAEVFTDRTPQQQCRIARLWSGGKNAWPRDSPHRRSTTRRCSGWCRATACRVTA
ncbi:alpha/beta fold hydrolase [Variovorax sp. YR266]|uniref:alpha/beta fold hydrolase n=1 Tax=Variovorax sp. YR266 TaxID=1884386 RepID=UPI00210F1186|nr:alpha/beta fold hydrolase [Variovorax sp. YR266]